MALLTGDSSIDNPFSRECCEPPNLSRQEISFDDAGFMVAWVLWFALLHENPYKLPGTGDDFDNIWHVGRLPFSGPPELGAVLETVLVADEQKRMKAAEFRDALRISIWPARGGQPRPPSSHAASALTVHRR